MPGNCAGSDLPEKQNDVRTVRDYLVQPILLPKFSTYTLQASGIVIASNGLIVENA
jgi:hypothetical protein